MRTDEHPYLIIGGTTKAGTTSLFKYLSDHPQICQASLKETRFFLDADYPLPAKRRFDGDISAYDEFFAGCDSLKIRMEATPDYLYCKTPLGISDLLPNAKLLFILRDPVERLISWFRFAKQIGNLSNDITFEKYVELQQRAGSSTNTTALYLRALEQGRYSNYIAPFLQRLPNRSLVLSFEKLKDHPADLMRELCDFAKLDSSFYDQYVFRTENETKEVRSQILSAVYRSLRRRLEYRVHNKKHALRGLRWVNRGVKALMELNNRRPTRLEVSQDLAENLKQYYVAEYKVMQFRA